MVAFHNEDKMACSVACGDLNWVLSTSTSLHFAKHTDQEWRDRNGPVDSTALVASVVTILREKDVQRQAHVILLEPASFPESGALLRTSLRAPKPLWVQKRSARFSSKWYRVEESIWCLVVPNHCPVALAAVSCIRAG